MRHITIRNIVKFCSAIFLFLCTAFLIAIVLKNSIDQYKKYRNLNYLAVSPCVRHDEYTQICEPTNEIKNHFFRKVDLDLGDIVVSYLDDARDSRYQYALFWRTECLPGTIIESGLFVPQNMRGDLECINQSSFFRADGSYVQMLLESAARIDDFPPFKGFSVTMDFSSTDYSILERELSINAAKTQAQIAEEQRTLAEARRVALASARERIVEQERAAAQAKLEQERVMQECKARNQVQISLMHSKLISQLQGDVTFAKCDPFFRTCSVSIPNRTAHVISSIELGVVQPVISRNSTFCPATAPAVPRAVQIQPNDTFELTAPSNGVVTPLFGCVVVVSAEFVGIESSVERCGM